MGFAPTVLTPEPGWNALIAEWLAGLFMAPLSVAAVDSYRQGLGAIFLEALTEEPAFSRGTRQMYSALTVDESSAAAARRLGAAYTTLFDGPAGPDTIPLYESAHISPSGRLFQAATTEMDLWLRQLDVSTATAFREPADHLSIELAVLARLMRLDVDTNAQAELLDAHLLIWTPALEARCCDADRSGFYAGATRVLSAFLLTRRTGLRVGPCQTHRGP